MDHPNLLTVLTFGDDGGATLLTYDLVAVDSEALRDLLGEPAFEQLLTAEEIAAHEAIPKGPYIVR